MNKKDLSERDICSRLLLDAVLSEALNGDQIVRDEPKSSNQVGIRVSNA
jgi:hypothetical protein